MQGGLYISDGGTPYDLIWENKMVTNNDEAADDL